MTRKKLNELYFAWLCQLIDEYDKVYSYQKILRCLYETEFIAN